MNDLLQKLEAAMALDEQWALACNLPYQYADEGATAPATGVHWRWVTGENWDTTIPDPVTMECVEGEDGSCAANLATVEEWPSGTRYGSSRMMPRTYAGTIEEMDPAAAGHIIRNDPARVLRRVARDRKLLARHYLIHRDIGWVEDGDEKTAELPVCGHCVPKHSWFNTRADVPVWPCGDVRDLAEDYEIEVES